tara:strand:+ start:2123 stop:2491 length:369 start_codon:yes stop_codon:yes gene_type:complete
MGLDQTAYIEDENSTNVIATWRKHPNLQGFMDDLFIERTGGHEPTHENMGSEGMNTPDTLELTLGDIKDLRKAIIDKTLPLAGGFFWGNDSSEDYYEDDLKFCDLAEKALLDNKKVIYECWW